jgi:hypothetical protein
MNQSLVQTIHFSVQTEDIKLDIKYIFSNIFDLI